MAAALVAASVVYVVRQAWHGGLGPADLVTVLGFPLAVAGVVGMLAGFRKSQEGVEADLALGQARSLARLVAESEGRVLTQLLGRDTARINLRYDLVPNSVRGASAPAAGLGIADPGVGLPDVSAYYRATRPARLVITGAPGAGKTVLALQLLLDLVANRQDTDPVPVRVPLAQWDTEVPLREVLAQRLVETFNLTKAVAANLVAHGLVLPVLDGLDEMDPTLPDGQPDPAAPRARVALDQLSAYQDAGRSAPLVLTCRTAHYDALTTADLLLDAARIAIAPVGSSPAASYLAARARDLPRWQPLLDHLTAHPGSVHAMVLSTPWRLCLTATVYHRTGDPTELLTHTGAVNLVDHLLARYITAAADSNPHGYTPRQIHHWLHQLAAHLAPTPGTPIRTDIALDRLWPMAGSARVRTADAALTALAFLLPLSLLIRPSDSLTNFSVVGALALLLGLSHGLVKETVAGRLDLRLLATPAGLRRLALGLTVVLLTGLLAGQLVGVVVWLQAGLVIGLRAGLWAGLSAGLWAGLSAGLVIGVPFVLTADLISAAKPRAIIGEDARRALTLALAVGLAIGLCAGLWRGVAMGVGAGLWAGLAVGLGIGLRMAPGASPSCASWRYVAFLLCARKRVPFRLARFLDWSCDAGLTRFSGSAYQFRHRELQLWLAAHPHPVA
ncbi:NACHT domain-containing protein [Streptomyces sp. ID05-04B]|uniref:NACHT domain-containing protein n=1 Tax=Streptomyces sp. ID05-04B TaxID=3028661 RepID=UPI0029C40AA0|nr:NACHT domain-containing protein [Streptomyces sp. ID05-04B]MDX5568007.1 NACHT domain-containing protein [Streptomyces sp. ID05-04B]